MKLGKSQYFTGKPCKNGHIDGRWVTNCTCFSCNAESKKNSPNRKEVNRKAKAKYYLENIDKILAKEQERYQNNREHILDTVRDYYRQNKDKIAEAKKNNRPYHTELQNRRRLKTTLQTPKWANLERIREIYKNCPEGYHVDHIVPISGDNVSGFHVENNLQYLTPKENLSKNNKYEAQWIQTEEQQREEAKQEPIPSSSKGKQG